MHNAPSNYLRIERPPDAARLRSDGAADPLPGRRRGDRRARSRPAAAASTTSSAPARCRCRPCSRSSAASRVAIPHPLAKPHPVSSRSGSACRASRSPSSISSATSAWSTAGAPLAELGFRPRFGLRDTIRAVDEPADAHVSPGSPSAPAPTVVDPCPPLPWHPDTGSVARCSHSDGNFDMCPTSHVSGRTGHPDGRRQSARPAGPAIFRAFLSEIRRQLPTDRAPRVETLMDSQVVRSRCREWHDQCFRFATARQRNRSHDQAALSTPSRPRPRDGLHRRPAVSSTSADTTAAAATAGPTAVAMATTSATATIATGPARAARRPQLHLHVQPATARRDASAPTTACAKRPASAPPTRTAPRASPATRHARRACPTTPPDDLRPDATARRTVLPGRRSARRPALHADADAQAQGCDYCDEAAAPAAGPGGHLRGCDDLQLRRRPARAGQVPLIDGTGCYTGTCFEIGLCDVRPGLRGAAARGRLPRRHRLHLGL